MTHTIDDASGPRAFARARRQWILPFAALLFLVSCQCKREMDAEVDKLVALTRENDHAAFKAIAHPELAVKFTPEKLDLMSRALARLGRYQERTMKQLEVEVGGERSGTYSLTFEKGTVRLKIAMNQGRLTTIAFGGEELASAMRVVEAEDARVLRVLHFQFLDDEDAPRNNLFRAGDDLKFRVGLRGVARGQDGSRRLRGDLRILDGDGQEVYRDPVFIDARVDERPDDSPIIAARGSLHVPSEMEAGSYAIELKLQDGNNHHSVEVREVFAIDR